MNSSRSNIVLIGMAGSGKSSIGRLLAEKLGRPFIDTDELIVQNRVQPLQGIIEAEGPFGFRRVEEKTLLGVNVRDHVIATGGSSVYSEPGMENLGRLGVIILLTVDPAILKKRVGDTSDRGLVKQPGQSFEELYAERKPLYARYADIVIECSHLDHNGVSEQIVEQLEKAGYSDLL